MPCRNNSFDTRCRALINPIRTSSWARTKSRAASSSRVGTRTAVICPNCSSRARCNASFLSFLTFSPTGRCNFEGAAITHSIPAASRARDKPKPVGPASYVVCTGPGNDDAHATTSALLPPKCRRFNSPVPPSSTHPATLRACTSKPTKLRYVINWGLHVQLVDRPTPHELVTHVLLEQGPSLKSQPTYRLASEARVSRPRKPTSYRAMRDIQLGFGNDLSLSSWSMNLV